MKLTLNTDKLKDMVSRAIKGAGNNKLIPITSLMAIELKDSVLTLITTDATNYLYIKEDKVVGDDFYVVIDANQFYKLVSKMTCDKVTLSVNEGIWSFNIKGNGNYKMELPLDENGEPIKYPDPYSKLTLVRDLGIVNRTTVQVILETIKPSLALTIENPCYTGYYVGDSVVATDSSKIANLSIKLLDEPTLISSEMMDLLSVMKAEKIKVDKCNDIIIFTTSDCVVMGNVLDGIEDFAIDAITDLVDTEYNSFCKVPKNTLLQLLDRLSLFVGPYDNNIIHLTFTNSGLQVSSVATNGVEIINYAASENFRDFTCSIDINMFITEIKAIQSDMIELYYGDDNAIKLVDGNITIIVALAEDEDVES